MAFHIIEEKLAGLKLIKADVYEDDRGFFMESWRADSFKEIGIDEVFLQDNHSRSQKGVLRGLHFQWDKPMGKLLRVTSGECLFVEVDIRKNSNTFGKHAKYILSDKNKQLLWVPPGFANGFLTLSENAEVQYKCTAIWNKNAESSIFWKDSNLNINWFENNEIDTPIVSAKDAEAQSLMQWIEREESSAF